MHEKLQKWPHLPHSSHWPLHVWDPAQQRTSHSCIHHLSGLPSAPVAWRLGPMPATFTVHAVQPGPATRVCQRQASRDTSHQTKRIQELQLFHHLTWLLGYWCDLKLHSQNGFDGEHTSVQYWTTECVRAKHQSPWHYAVYLYDMYLLYLADCVLHKHILPVSTDIITPLR